MAQAALSYQQPQRRRRELEVPQRPPLVVLPGRAPSAAPDAGLISLWKTLCVSVVITVLVIGSLSILRVRLADVTMGLFSGSAQISQSIDAERSEGARWEAEYSLASNPSVIQDAAARLGMGPASQVEYLHISITE